MNYYAIALHIDIRYGVEYNEAMLKIQVTTPIELDLDEVLEGIAHLEASELELFTEKVIALRAQRITPSLTPKETELLQKINQGVPYPVRSQYERLHQKMLDKNLTADEQQVLLELSDQIELADAERLRHLMALAQLRGVPIDELMDQLGIRQPTYA